MHACMHCILSSLLVFYCLWYLHGRDGTFENKRAFALRPCVATKAPNVNMHATCSCTRLACSILQGFIAKFLEEPLYVTYPMHLFYTISYVTILCLDGNASNLWTTQHACNTEKHKMFLESVGIVIKGSVHNAPFSSVTSAPNITSLQQRSPISVRVEWSQPSEGATVTGYVVHYSDGDTA